ncbi:shikimate dehydrogenase [Pseudonocardia adelaidensis]|uniref:Shikimate dehydrogenase (NADP(+)) n=1 Tax=Pseudonocardia adelaidensis TaxID=648754 RepID=A0ABP9NWZ7_9PSEU
MSSDTADLLVGLVGSGIGPSLSPALHMREARELGLPYRYVRLDLDALRLPAEGVGHLLRQARVAGFRGLNVTHPCKQLVIPHLDALDPAAEAIGAVNTVVFDDGRAIGHNTDWTGFRDGLLDGLPHARLDRVVLIGAGGAGAAASHALLTIGAGTVDVLDADAARACRLATALAGRFGAGRATGGAMGELPDRARAADGVVHATPTGMSEHPGLPIPAALLRPELWVAEIVYRPLDTELLRAARAAGCPTLDGGRMAVHQAAEAFRLFTGVDADVGRMRAHLTELVRGEAGEGGDRVA